MSQDVRIERREVPYEECDARQRVAWDWLWNRLLKCGGEVKHAPAPAQTPDDQAGSLSKCSDAPSEDGASPN